MRCWRSGGSRDLIKVPPAKLCPWNTYNLTTRQTAGPTTCCLQSKQAQWSSLSLLPVYLLQLTLSSPSTLSSSPFSMAPLASATMPELAGWTGMAIMPRWRGSMSSVRQGTRTSFAGWDRRAWRERTPQGSTKSLYRGLLSLKKTITLESRR